MTPRFAWAFEDGLPGRAKLRDKRPSPFRGLALPISELVSHRAADINLRPRHLNAWRATQTRKAG